MYNAVPNQIQTAFQQIDDDFRQLLDEERELSNKLGQQAGFDYMKQHWVHTNGEDKVDVLASLLGFQKAVLAKIDYMISCVETYQGPAKASGNSVTPQEVLEQLRFRRQQVTRYGGEYTR